jgi:hypothetical protein
MSEHAGEQHPNNQGDIVFFSPTDGAEFSERQFTLVAQFANVPNLDHAHYGIANSIESASKGGFTFPDLTGAVTVQLNPEWEDGTYYICAYLADINHVHLSETHCVGFKLATSGTVPLTPQPGSVVQSYSVEIDATTYGYLPQRLESLTTRVTIDGSTPIETESLPLTVILNNGNHSIELAMVTDTGEILGATSTVNFEVRSQLTLTNLDTIARLLNKAVKIDSETRAKRLLRKATILLDSMATGNDQHPSCPELSADRIKKLGKSLKRAARLPEVVKATRRLLVVCGSADSGL